MEGKNVLSFEILTRNVSQIKFDLMSSREIVENSVCLVNSTNNSGENTISDFRMGPDSGKEKCHSCDEEMKDCTGHFGHIHLNEPILHPLYVAVAKQYISLICANIKCNRVLIKKSIAKLHNFDRITKNARYKKSLELLNGIIICPHCGEAVVQYEVKEGRIHSYLTDKKNSTEIGIKQIENIFGNCDTRDQRLVGFTVDPIDLILTDLPVLPRCARPSVKSGNDNCDDDLSYKYIDIIKANEKLLDPAFKNRKQELISNIEFHISTMWDNSKKKARQITSKRPIKCIKQRLSGKQGLMRQNIMGKRVDFSGRTVFNVDPTLSVNWVGLPKDFRFGLTYPEHVNEYNTKYWENEIDKGEVSRIIRGNDIIRVDYASKDTNKKVEYKSSDIVYRLKSEIITMQNAVGGKRIEFYEKLMENGKIDVVFRRIKNEEKSKELAREVLELKKIYDITCTDINEDKIKLEVGDKVYRNDLKEAMREITPEMYVYNKGNNFVLRSSDKIYRKSEDGSKLQCLKNLSLPTKKKIQLQVGDIVERFLKDGDVILYNRQPTLHKYSFIAAYVVFRNQKSMTLNTSMCAPLNADCDGDELNIHVPQSLMTIAEALELMAIKKNLVGGRDSSSVVGICQDSLTGGFLSTNGARKVFFSVKEIQKLKDKTPTCSKMIENIDKSIVKPKNSKSKLSLSPKYMEELENINREKMLYYLETKKSQYVEITRELFFQSISVMDWSWENMDGKESNIFKKMEHIKSVYCKEKGIPNEEGHFEDVVQTVKRKRLVKPLKPVAMITKTERERLLREKGKKREKDASGQYVLVPIRGWKGNEDGGFLKKYKKEKEEDSSDNEHWITEEFTSKKRVYIPSQVEKEFLFTGHGLFSMLLPDNLEIVYNNMVRTVYLDDKKINEPVVIKQGVMLSGSLSKDLVGKKNGSLIQVLNTDYNEDICVSFINNYQNMIDCYLLERGFSVGLQDCTSGTVDQNGNDWATVKAEEEMLKIFLEAKEIYDTEKDQKMLERKINGVLNKSATIGEVIAKNSLRRDNAFASMILPGAKGNFVNVSQIITCMGQQNVDGKRMQYLFKGRTLPHYPKDLNYLNGKKNEKQAFDFSLLKEDIKNISSKDIILFLRKIFVSRGFGDNGLYKGLSPQEFFFHAMGGREGIIDTAVKTQISGYISRRLVKKQEDLKSTYYGTIVNTRNSILSFDYNNGFDPCKTTNIGGESFICNIKRLAKRMNREYEIANGIDGNDGENVFSVLESIERSMKFDFSNDAITFDYSI